MLTLTLPYFKMTQKRICNFHYSQKKCWKVWEVFRQVMIFQQPQPLLLEKGDHTFSFFVRNHLIKKLG